MYGSTPELVRRQLEKILDSPIFSQAGRLRRFLEYVVDRTLRGKAHELKEYTTGLAVQSTCTAAIECGMRTGSAVTSAADPLPAMVRRFA
jgi:hypothetical protein